MGEDMISQHNIDTVIFDLDGTLINTEKLKDAFKEIAVRYGCTSKEAGEVYQLSRTKINPETNREEMAFCREYFEEKLREFLSKKGKEIGQVDFSELNKLLCEDLLIDGAVELIEETKRMGFDIYLITLGTESWQKDKLRGSGLGKYFKFDEGRNSGNILITADNEQEGGRKIGAIREKFGRLFDGSDVVLFNDKPWETKLLLEKFPEMQAFVPRQVRDTRYDEGDFERAQEEVGSKFIWGDSLNKLREEFELFLKGERYDGARR